MTEHKHNDDDARTGSGRYGGKTDPTPKTPEPPSALPPGYEPQPYPKAVYHPDGRSKTVANELDEDTAKLEGFVLDAPPPPKDAPEAK